MKPLLSTVLFFSACLASWGLVFAFAACAARFIGIFPAFLITLGCILALLAWFWHETRQAQ